jgi:hypothetical protein
VGCNPDCLYHGSGFGRQRPSPGLRPRQAFGLRNAWHAGVHSRENRFSNFRYHQATSGLPSSAISMTPGTSPDNDDPGLMFEAKWVAPSAQSSVSYTIDVQPKGKPISGATLQMQFGEITGAGEAKVVTEICPQVASADNCGAPELKLHVVLSTGSARKVSDTGQRQQFDAPASGGSPVERCGRKGWHRELQWLYGGISRPSGESTTRHGATITKPPY